MKYEVWKGNMRGRKFMECVETFQYEVIADKLCASLNINEPEYDIFYHVVEIATDPLFGEYIAGSR